MNSLASDLRATAQAKALNDVLANEQAKMKKRYNDAYNASQIRQTNPNPTKDPEGEVEFDGNGRDDLTTEPSTSQYYTTSDNYVQTETVPDNRGTQRRKWTEKLKKFQEVSRNIKRHKKLKMAN